MRSGEPKTLVDGQIHGDDPRGERIHEGGADPRGDEPDGHAAAHRPVPVYHGLCLLEGWEAPRARRVSCSDSLSVSYWIVIVISTFGWVITLRR